MAQRRYKIFQAQQPSLRAIHTNPQNPTQPVRITPVLQLNRLNQQSLQQKQLRPQRKSMFAVRQYKRAQSQSPEKGYSYNIQNHISQEGDLFNCNLLDCYIMDHEEEQLLGNVNIVKTTHISYEETQAPYHAQYRPYIDNCVQTKQLTNQDQQVQQAALQNATKIANHQQPHQDKRRVSIFSGETSTARPNSYFHRKSIFPQHNANNNTAQLCVSFLQAPHAEYPISRTVNDRRAQSLDTNPQILNSLVLWQPRPKQEQMSTINEEPSQRQISSKNQDNSEANHPDFCNILKDK